LPMVSKPVRMNRALPKLKLHPSEADSPRLSSDSRNAASTENGVEQGIGDGPRAGPSSTRARRSMDFMEESPARGFGEKGRSSSGILPGQREGLRPCRHFSARVARGEV